MAWREWRRIITKTRTHCLMSTTVAANTNTSGPARQQAADLVRRALHHPAVMSAKRRWRDLRWRMTHGDGPGHPPLPAGVRSVTFVCLGNICRSPFAGYLAARRLAAAGRRDLRIASAGLNPTQSGRSPDLARQAARVFGVDLDAHRPIALSSELAASSDLIIGMEPAHIDEMRARHPHLAQRLQLLSAFDPQAKGYERYHVDDPFLGPPEGYVYCYSRIDRAVTGLLAALAATDKESHA